MRTVRFLAVTAAITGSFALSAATAGTALAAVPSPTVTTDAATNVTASSATVNGTVNANGQATSYYFQYGPSSSFGAETTRTAIPAATTPAPVSADVTGLTSGTTYYYRVVAVGPNATVDGATKTLSTSGTAPKATAKPVTTTGSASEVTQSSATLTGSVNPSGQATSYYFEYGTTTSYGNLTPVTSAGSGTSAATASAAIANLLPTTTYHYRLVAESAGGLVVGRDATFKTPTPPPGTTGGASNVTQNTATLSGTLNPQGHNTTYYFQYGTTTAYGQSTGSSSAGNGTSSITVTSTVTNLAPSTTYHYRLVVTGPGGTTLGADQTFTTSAPVLSRITLIGREAFVSPGNVLGIPVGCFYGGTRCRGRVQVIVGRRVIASRNYTQRSGTGGFVNMKLSRRGIALVAANRAHHLLRARVVVAGAPVGTISIARWIW